MWTDRQNGCDWTACLSGLRPIIIIIIIIDPLIYLQDAGVIVDTFLLSYPDENQEQKAFSHATGFNKQLLYS